LATHDAICQPPAHLLEAYSPTCLNECAFSDISAARPQSMGAPQGGTGLCPRASWRPQEGPVQRKGKNALLFGLFVALPRSYRLSIPPSGLGLSGVSGNTPSRNCPKRGMSNARSVTLAGIRRAKWTERPLCGSPRDYAAGASEAFRTVSVGDSILRICR